jgi:hypothetical protein
MHAHAMQRAILLPHTAHRTLSAPLPTRPLHTSLLRSKIVLLKEEGDASHVNQSYDQKVALDDKKSMRQSLAYLRQSNKLVKGTVDGWQLIHVALAAVRELDPDSWVHSFDKVNLKPSTRVGFDKWCTRIAHYLQAVLIPAACLTRPLPNPNCNPNPNRNQP